MPFKTFVAGAVLTASDVNTYLAKQSVIVCTSTTRPSSPPEGMTIYETDTDRLLVYTTSTTGWTQPWNMPWGRLNSSTGTATTNIGTSYVDVNGLSVSWDAVQNRRYRITSNFTIVAPRLGTSDCNVDARYVDGATTETAAIRQTATIQICFNNMNLVELYSHTTASNSVSRKVQARVSATTGNELSLSYNRFIVVDDMGPAGAPA